MQMRRVIILMTIFATLTILSCKKLSDCYDSQMEKNHSGICPQDCPGVCGCDGNTYCNECMANSKGITVVSNGPCK